jgi:hypothetical protein
MLVGHPMHRTHESTPVDASAPSIPSIESAQEQGPGDDLFHEPRSSAGNSSLPGPLPRPPYVATTLLERLPVVDTSPIDSDPLPTVQQPAMSKASDQRSRSDK